MIHDVWLARRIEATHARSGELAAEAVQRLHPERGTTFERIAGGSMIFAGQRSFYTHALGVGVGVEVSETDLRRLEAFYFERGASVELDLCPFADRTLPGRLFDRGYRPAHFEQALVRRVEPDDAGREISESGDIELAPASPEDSAGYGELMRAAFDLPRQLDEALLDAGRVAFASRGVRVFTARARGELVAAGAMGIHEGVVSLFGAATLPDFRGRGLHSRLLALRLREAARQGCDLAVVTSLLGSISQRNIERMGFHPAYTRTVLVKSFER